MALNRGTLVAMVVIAMSGCASKPDDYPLTQTGKSFTELDASQSGRAPAVATNVTGERLANAKEPHNWPRTTGHTMDNVQSTLDQITVENVNQLRPAWVFQADHSPRRNAGHVCASSRAHRCGRRDVPLRVGRLRVGARCENWTAVLAVPAYDSARRPLCCGNVNRGVAVAEGKVFFATLNGHVVALDASNGKVMWQQVFVDVRAGESATMAPLIIKDKVIVGSSGAEYGVRGHIDAFDLRTGKRLWRRIPYRNRVNPVRTLSRPKLHGNVEAARRGVDHRLLRSGAGSLVSAICRRHRTHKTPG